MKDQVVEWFGEHHKELMDREEFPFDSGVLFTGRSCRLSAPKCSMG